MKNTIAEFIFIDAMRDATMQQAYPGEKTFLTTNEELRKSIVKQLSKFADAIIKDAFKSQAEYDNEFKTISKQICNRIRNIDGGRFTFGNAQKLINMFVKYIYIITFADTEKRAAFQFCHCPMDSQLLEKVWRNRNALLDDETRKGMGSRDEFLKSWGRMDFDDNMTIPNRYIVFQNAVRELVKNKYGEFSNLEYDYIEWKRKQ